MKNNALLNEELALSSEAILKVTALLYLKEALVNQEYETCKELIDSAKNFGAEQDDITAVITDYLNTNLGGRQRQNRLR